MSSPYSPDNDEDIYGKNQPDNERSGGEYPLMTLPYFIKKRENEDDILQKLREEGILPISKTHQRPVSFYVDLDRDNDGNDARCKKVSTKLPRPACRVKSDELFDPIEKLIIADVRHQEMLREKGAMGRNYKNRYTKVKEKQQKKAEDLRKKLEEKWKLADENVTKRGKRNANSSVIERVANARLRKDSMEREFKEKTAKKLQEEEEKMKKLETNEKISTVEKRQTRALHNREELLRYRQKMYEDKLRRVEESRKRREEFHRKMCCFTQKYSSS